jgi:hypothetical protein
MRPVAPKRLMTEAEFRHLPAERVGRRLESPLLPGFALGLRALFAGRSYRAPRR